MMEDLWGAHEAHGTDERHIKHLRSRPDYEVRPEPYTLGAHSV